MATQHSPPKKVRLACQRCRTRRIKCDGQVPACTNCSKAGEPCIDVDSQNSRVLIPRNFASAARARIQWLEAIVRERAPDVDLTTGPNVDLPDTAPHPPPVFQPGPENDGDVVVVVSPSSPTAGGLSRTLPTADSSSGSRHSRKRSAEVSGPVDHDSTFPERAHSVAVNLGMLSLNSDSPQKHYLGSSSGLLFANLINALPSSTRTAPSAFTDDPSVCHDGQSEWQDDRAHDHTHQYHESMLNLVRQELPRKDDAIVLAHTYIRWVHPDFPVMEPSSIMSALDALYTCVSSTQNTGDLHANGWPRTTPSFRWNGEEVSVGFAEDDAVSLPVIAFIVFMIFHIAAVVKVRSRIYEFSPDKFYRAAMKLSQGAFSQMTLPSLQCLVVLICSSMLSPGQVKLWTLVHLALAHCVELGIHREPQDDEELDLASRQIRRFIFWTVYSLDRSISSIQGRPLGFRDETFDVKPPTVMDAGTTLSAFSEDVTEYSSRYYQLSRILSDIKLHLYHLPGDSSVFPWPANPEIRQLDIHKTLVSWHNQLIEVTFDLDQRQSRIWKIKLDIQFHNAIILLFQPSQVIRHPSEEALKTCFDTTLSILQKYQLLHDLHGLHFGWRAVQNIFAAGATLIYSFWTSALVRSTASPSDTSRSLRICSNLLTIGGEWWSSAKNGQRSLNSVVDLTVRRLYMEDVASKHPRLSNALSKQTARPERRTDNQAFERRAISTLPSGNALNTGEGSLYHDPDPVSSRSIFDVAKTGDLGADAALHALHSANTDEVASEIETFLADFDSSEFTWSFPMDNTRHGQGPFPDFGF